MSDGSMMVIKAGGFITHYAPTYDTYASSFKSWQLLYIY